MPSMKPQFVHRFVPATQPDLGVTLLLLHGCLPDAAGHG
jgi:hypothetical protein